MASQPPEDPAESQASDELECKICYNRYNLKQRKPKVLECCHRVCAKCLYKIIDFGDSPQGVIVCPFCRFETCLPDDEVSSLPDDNNILVNLTCGGKGKKCLPENPTELLLTPKRLASLVSPSHTSSNCLVITIMEVQRESSPSLSSTPVVEFYRPASFDSVTTVSHNWTVWNCTSLLFQTSIRVLVWLLGLLYFSSLPLGIYLLVSKKVTLGVVFVSLVPSSLVILMVYGFCQCVCHEFLDCMASPSWLICKIRNWTHIAMFECEVRYFIIYFLLFSLWLVSMTLIKPLVMYWLDWFSCRSEVKMFIST